MNFRTFGIIRTMKRAIIVHCWGGNPDYAWYPWLKSELDKQGYQTTIPAMPDTDEPKLDKWLPLLKQTVGKPDSNLVLIGHSLGCITIMRYLESLDETEKIGKVVFVAGFTDQLGFREIENFFDDPINFEKIKTKSLNGFVAIQSDNDPFVSEQYGQRLKEEFEAKLIIKNNAGHMSGEVDNEEACIVLPEVLENI